jgi:LEM3-like protein/NUMOD3 motif-containing protein
MNIFYVYLLLDPLNDYLPFYIGKGKNKRARTHLYETKENTENLRKWHKIQKIREAGFEPVIQYWSTNMEENAAYDLEKDLIERFGRAKINENGILTNICKDLRPPTRKQSGELNHRFGKHWTEQDKDKQRAIALANGNRPPSNKGSKHNEATKSKMSAASKGKPKSPEHRRKLSEAAKKITRGRPSAATIEKIRQSNVGIKKRSRTPEEREINSERARQMWENMSDTKKAARSEKARQRWAQKTDKEKALFCRKVREAWDRRKDKLTKRDNMV